MDPAVLTHDVVAGEIGVLDVFEMVPADRFGGRLHVGGQQLAGELTHKTPRPLVPQLRLHPARWRVYIAID